MKVLHIIPETVCDPRHFYLGSTKDIRNRTEYFKKRGLEYYEMIAEERSDEKLLRKIRETDLSQYSIIIVEYTYYPKALNFMRSAYPAVKLFIRSHNADLYHWLDYAKATLQHSSGKEGAFFIDTALNRFRQDHDCAEIADHILGITDWEKENYWKYVTNIKNATTVPYFLPEAYMETISQDFTKKKKCVCLTSTIRRTTPILMDITKNFSQLVHGMESGYADWEFIVTGDEASAIDLSPRITTSGFLENPLDLLCESRTVFIASDFGCGFKTKVLEAILCKCFVIVTRKLYEKLPKEVLPYCIVIDPTSVTSFTDALDRSLDRFPDGNPNEILRSRAFDVLDTLFRMF